MIVTGDPDGTPALVAVSFYSEGINLCVLVPSWSNTLLPKAVILLRKINYATKTQRHQGFSSQISLTHHIRHRRSHILINAADADETPLQVKLLSFFIYSYCALQDSFFTTSIPHFGIYCLQQLIFFLLNNFLTNL